MKKIIKLLKRNPKKNSRRGKTHIYDICVVRKSARGRFVYEKLGCYSSINNIFSINVFRLIFWMSKNVSLTGNAARLFFSSSIFQAVSY